MAVIAVIPFMPILRDLDARQGDRAVEGNEIERFGEAPGKVGRQGSNAVSLRRDAGGGDEARYLQENVAWPYLAGQCGLRGTVSGMTDVRGRHQDMLLAKKAVA